MARKCGFLLFAIAISIAAVGVAAELAAPGYHVIKKIAPGGEGGWDYLTIDPVARRLFIARSDRVMVFDVDKGVMVGEIPNTPGVHGVAIAPKLGRGFTSNGSDSTVTVFDLKTLKEQMRINVGKRPDAILYDQESSQLFTFNALSADATVVDPAAGKVNGTIPLGGKPESAVADGRGHVYVNIEDKNEVLELDTHKLSVLHRWPVTPGEQPAGLAMDLLRRRLFCTCRNEKMVVLNADNGKVLETLPIGKHTDACVFDPATRLAFSSNGDGTLTVVRTDAGDHYDVAETVTTQTGARTMALDPTTHNLFLVTAVARPGEKHSFEPDTFVIIVVARPTKPVRPVKPQPGAPKFPRPN